MAKKFPLSFKETERDQKLYKTCMSKGDRSNYVKDCIEFYIDYHARTVTAVQEYQEPTRTIEEMEEQLLSKQQQQQEVPKPTIEIVEVDEGILDIMGV